MAIKGKRVFQISRPYKKKRKTGKLIANPAAGTIPHPVATNEPQKKPAAKATGLAAKAKSPKVAPAAPPAAPAPAPAPAPVKTDKPDYDGMSYRELQGEAKKHGIKGVGVKKADLLAQLKAL